MEILNVFGVHWKLLLAQVVNFSIALFILHRYLYKPVFAMLKKRQDIIAKGLADAKEAEVARLAIDGERETMLQSAREEGGRIVSDLRRQGAEKEHEMVRHAEEQSSQILSDAQKRGEAMCEHLLRESEKDVARMAVLAAEKILREGAVRPS